jgi:SP family sugar:H+ symporter-like MFS transporter
MEIENDKFETIQIHTSRTSSKITISSQNRNHKFTYRKFKVLLLTLNASMGFLIIGYTIGVFDPILPRLAELKNWDKEAKRYYESFLSSAVGFGAIFGGLIAGIVLRKLGRRRSFIFYDMLVIIGTILTLIDDEIIMIIGRCVSGMCVGGFMTLVPVYVSEFVPYEITGSSGAIYEMHFCIGIMLSYLLGFGLPQTQTVDDNYWRFMVSVPLLFCIINIIILLFVFTYDTPRYLYLNKNDKETCRQCLYSIYYNEDDVNLMMNDFKSMSNCQNNRISISQAFSKEYITRFIVCMSIIITQQSCGIDVYLMYSETIFLEHITEKTIATIFTNLVGLSQFIAGVISIFIIDKIGRRKFLVWGQVLLFTNSAILALLYYFKLHAIAIYFFIAFVFVNGITLSPVAFIYCTDVLPENIYAFGVVFNNVANMGVTNTYPYLRDSFFNIGGTIGIYTFFIGINLLLCTLFAKETKDKSSKEIDQMFNPYKKPLI